MRVGFFADFEVVFHLTIAHRYVMTTAVSSARLVTIASCYGLVDYDRVELVS